MKPLVRLLKEIAYQGLESFGKYYSAYRGFVYDNDDPQNMGRLQLCIPHIMLDEVYTYWAYPRNIFSGKDYGMQLLPQKGDTVWVEFEHGNPSLPIWSLGYFGKNEFPTDDPDYSDPNCYWLKTPKGNRVKINDTKNIIEVKLATGELISIKEDSISLVSDKAISLGTQDKSKYKAVLGDEIQDLVDKMTKQMGDFNKALSTDLLSSEGGAFLKKTALNAAMPGLSKGLTAIQAQAKKLLSDKVTLD